MSEIQPEQSDNPEPKADVQESRRFSAADERLMKTMWMKYGSKGDMMAFYNKIKSTVVTGPDPTETIGPEALQVLKNASGGDIGELKTLIERRHLM